MDSPAHFRHLRAHEAYFSQHGRRVEYSTRQYFIRSDDPAPWVFLLKEGLVKVSFSLADGTERIIGYILPGTPFGQNRAFFGDDGGGLEYSTASPCIMYRISQDNFSKQAKADPAFNQDYTTSLLRNQRFLIDRIVYQGEISLYNRCLRWLLFMAKYYGELEGKGSRITVPLTQDAIGNFLHVSRESVSKSLGQLVHRGLISVESKYITIPNLGKIKAELE